MLSKRCKFCGCVFYKNINESYKSWINRRKYCSRNCSDMAKIGMIPHNKGLKYPNLLGEKSSQWKGGLPRCIVCGNKLSTYNPKTMMCQKCYCKSMGGENFWNWKGGITTKNHLERNSAESKAWRKSCLERDNFTCQITKQRGGDLEIHHINNFSDFPELRTSIENGITLSKEIHKNFHSIYGYRNNTKEQLEEFIINFSSLCSEQHHTEHLDMELC